MKALCVIVVPTDQTAYLVLYSDSFHAVVEVASLRWEGQVNTHTFHTITCTSSHPSGVATPGHTQACAHVKFAGARVKIM